MRVLLALAVLCQRGSLLPLLHGTTAKQIHTGEQNLNVGNKSVEFVNIIKEDLRRNNDDYELPERENQLEHSEPPARPAQHVHPAPPARRGYPTHPAYPALPGRPTPQQPRLLPAHPAPAHVAPPARAAPLRRFDNHKGVPAKLNQHVALQSNEFKSYTRSKLHKNQRLNKLKQLLNKDQVTMRQQELNQPQAEDQIQAEDQPLAEDQPHTEDKTQAEDQLQPDQTKVEDATVDSPPPRTSSLEDPPLDDREESPVLRNRKEYSPSPEQLDMAAARNSELTRIRIKGRLCQRSLMNAEGPTYDKLGNMLRPAHRARSARGRQFHQTRAPGLLLPRCCNCCKKSVLGCQ